MTPLAWFLLGYLSFPLSVAALVPVGMLAVRLFLGPKPQTKAGSKVLGAGLQ